MDEQHQHFPGLWGALWLVVACLLCQVAFSSVIQRLAPQADDGWVEALALLLANAAFFTVLLRYKRLSLGALFHPSDNSVQATLFVTALPVLALVPALMLLTGWIGDALLAWFPMSPFEEQLFKLMMDDSFASVLATCLLAPLFEEMLFRGVILRSFLHRYAPRVAIVHSAAIFGLAHLNIYQFGVAMLLGLVLGWLYERTRSLWPGIALHAMFNIAAVWDTHTDFTLADPLPIAVAALLTGAMALSWLRKILRPSPAQR